MFLLVAEAAGFHHNFHEFAKGNAFLTSLSEQLIHLSAPSLHPLSTASADVLAHCSMQVLDNLKETTSVRIMRDEEIQELLRLVHALFQGEKAVVVGEERGAEHDGRVENGVDQEREPEGQRGEFGP